MKYIDYQWLQETYHKEMNNERWIFVTINDFVVFCNEIRFYYDVIEFYDGSEFVGLINHNDIKTMELRFSYFDEIEPVSGDIIFEFFDDGSTLRTI